MQFQVNNALIENTFSVSSEADLIQAFRPRDQKKLILPDCLEYPFNVRSYFTWQEPSSVYTYLVFKMPNWDMPRGVAFKRTAPTGEPVGGLCSWCHAYGASNEIGMLSVPMNNDVSFSYILCDNLSCIEKIEETSARAGKDPSKQIQELYHKMEKLFERISSYKLD